MKRYRDTDYFVKEDGRVISTKFGKTKELKPSINKDGYYHVALSTNNIKKTFFVSRLVAECYHPNPNNLPEVEHIDCNKSNNHVSNLEWVTHSENIKRAKENGLLKGRPLGFKHSEDTKSKISINRKGEKHSSGENNPKSKLTEKEVIWIRKNYIKRDKEFGGTPLSKKYNVSKHCISSIIHNKNWKHI